MLWLEELERETRAVQMVHAVQGQEAPTWAEVRDDFLDWLEDEPKAVDPRLRLLRLR